MAKKHDLSECHVSLTLPNLFGQLDVLHTLNFELRNPSHTNSNCAIDTKFKNLAVRRKNNRKVI
jgi:hypothetical protein